MLELDPPLNWVGDQPASKSPLFFRESTKCVDGGRAGAAAARSTTTPQKRSRQHMKALFGSTGPAESPPVAAAPEPIAIAIDGYGRVEGFDTGDEPEAATGASKRLFNPASV